MTQRKPSKKRKKETTYKIWICLLSGISSFYAFLNYQEHSDLVNQQAIIHKQITEQEERFQELQRQKDYFDSDAYIEQIAREEFGFIKPNEIIYITNE